MARSAQVTGGSPGQAIRGLQRLARPPSPCCHLPTPHTFHHTAPPQRHVAAVSQLVSTRGRLTCSLVVASSSAESPVAPRGAAQGCGLISWVTANGGSVAGSIQIANAGANGWCLSAAESLLKGEVTILLPEACHLTYDTKSDPALLRLIEQVPEELWGARLALQVLAHRANAEDSHFSEYIGLLPKAVEGIPMFFSGPAIKALQYPTLIAQVTKRCRFLLEFAQGELDRVGSPLLHQLIDMCNHSFTANCEIKPAPGGAVQMVTTREVAKGEELLLNYGALGNDFLLLDYGFVVPDNPHDACQLRFDLSLLEAGRIAGEQLGEEEDSGSDSSDDEDTAAAGGLKMWQQQMLAELGLLGKDNVMVFIGGPASQPVDKRLLAAARVLCAKDPSDLRTLRAQIKDPVDALGTWMLPMPPKREAATMRMMVGLSALMLSQFPTTLQEDIKAITPGTPDSLELEADNRSAMTFRVEIKKTLAKAISIMSSRLKSIPGESAGSGGSSKPKAKRASKGKGKGKGRRKM